MSMKKQIGIFWGPESLSLAETQRDQLIFAATIPRQIPTSSEPSTGLQNVTAPENIHLTAAVQRLIRELKINKPNVHLAIPMRDIIFRTFSLPVMNPQEIENAVMFEAPRYIPFKLNELFYTYHAVAFTEKDVKKNQILFLAIRRDTFDQYIKTLEDAELEVSFAEPSVLALLRILAIKKLAKSNQTIALVQASDTQGVVMIANHQIPQFIRDFNLFKTIASSPSEPELKSLTERILNEVRISLEFYARQNKAAHPENRIEQIYVFASQNASEIAQGLRTDLGIKATFLDINDIFPYENSLPPDMANA
ncbi:MAG: pilus assembly protein PilM, partial [Candidatus Omnitrophica bacterium]|nr:pilus assembly protein PilM [Candidatus Omnitrophota bacterium]